MILLLHNNAPWLAEYQKYLATNKISHFSLGIEELINKVEIIETIAPNISKCIWKDDKTEIDFSKISGIYHQIFNLDNKLFDNFVEEDREYARTEWFAYLFYRLSEYTNTINPITTEYISGAVFQFPYYFSIAQKHGLEVPEYLVSTEFANLSHYAQNKKYIIKTDLCDIFSRPQKGALKKNCGIGIVDYMEGAPLFIHAIGDRLFGTIIFKDRMYKFGLEVEFEDKIKKFINRLNFKVCELFFRYNLKKGAFLYYVSLQPNWNFCVFDKKDIWAEITTLLLRN
jgi:hypothetical protein